MAVTKIWPVRGKVGSPLDYVANESKTANPRWDKDSLQNLTDVMHYAADVDKTEKQFFVSGVNCTPAIARDQFVSVKKQFDKEDGIVAWHGYQSFAEDEVTPEQAHEIGLEFARRVWGDDYQVIVATHLNTNHFHNHFVINSVSFKHGKRLRAKQWYELNNVSDEICKAHGLSVIEERSGSSLPRGLYEIEKRGGLTRFNIAKDAIDEAIRLSTNIKELELSLKSMGYYCNFNPNRKHWTIRLETWQKPIRIDRIGSEYTNERLQERLRDGAEGKTFVLFQKSFYVKRYQYKLQTRAGRIGRMGGLKGLYLHYCYLLGYLPGYMQRPTRISPMIRDDIIKLEQISREARFLCRENISTMDELVAAGEKNQSLIDTKVARQRELRNLIRRKLPETEKEVYRGELNEVNNQLKSLREEKKLIIRIQERSKAIEVKVNEVEKECEVIKDERRR